LPAIRPKLRRIFLVLLIIIITPGTESFKGFTVPIETTVEFKRKQNILFGACGNCEIPPIINSFFPLADEKVQ